MDEFDIEEKKTSTKDTKEYRVILINVSVNILLNIKIKNIKIKNILDGDIDYIDYIDDEEYRNYLYKK